MAQTDADRAADARRYRKDRKKRIAAEKAYKEKVAKTPAGKAKTKARAKVNNAVRDGRMKKPEGADFHHTSYSGEKPKGTWVKKSTHRRMPKKKGAK